MMISAPAGRQSKQAWKQAVAPNYRIVEAGKNTRFVKGDPRIRPGPGRPPLWWKHLLSRQESAIDLIGGVNYRLDVLNTGRKD